MPSGRHFLIGLSARTNEAGAAQLAAILARYQYTSSTLDIRRSPLALLHLKSGIAYLGERRFLVAPGFPPMEELARYDMIEVAAGEIYAANAVRVNDEVLIASGFPIVASILEKLRYRVRSLDMSEFAKMDGGLSWVCRCGFRGINEQQPRALVFTWPRSSIRGRIDDGTWFKGAS